MHLGLSLSVWRICPRNCYLSQGYLSQGNGFGVRATLMISAGARGGEAPRRAKHWYKLPTTARPTQLQVFYTFMITIAINLYMYMYNMYTCTSCSYFEFKGYIRARTHVYRIDRDIYL